MLTIEVRHLYPASEDESAHVEGKSCPCHPKVIYDIDHELFGTVTIAHRAMRRERSWLVLQAKPVKHSRPMRGEGIALIESKEASTDLALSDSNIGRRLAAGYGMFVHDTF